MEKRLETLSAERLDNDFVTVFRPIHTLQMIFGCLKVNIKYGFVTRCSNPYIVYCVCLWALNILATIRFVTHCDLASDALFDDVFLKIGHVIYDSTIFISFLNHLICNRDKMSVFFVQLQKIDREMSLKSQAVNRNISRKCIFASVASTISNVFWIILYDLFLVKTRHWYTYLTLLPTIGNLLDILMCYVILYFILKRLEYIESRILLIGSANAESVNQDQKRVECNWNVLSNGVQLVPKCLSDFAELFQYQILSFTCQLLLWTILTVQCVIHKFKYQMHVSTSSVVFVLFTLSSQYLIIILLCRLSGMLHGRLDNIKRSCSNIRASGQGVSKVFAKRMLLLLEVDSSLTIYNVYTLDSRLPFQLFAIIASYTIILLQFAML